MSFTISVETSAAQPRRRKREGSEMFERGPMRVSFSDCRGEETLKARGRERRFSKTLFSPLRMLYCIPKGGFF